MWLNAMAIWPAQHGWHPKWTLYHCGTFDPFGLFLLNIYIYIYMGAVRKSRSQIYELMRLLCFARLLKPASR